MKEEQLPKVYYRGNEFVMVQKAPEGFGPGSVVYVDANEDGDYEFQSIVGKDGIWHCSGSSKGRASPPPTRYRLITSP